MALLIVAIIAAYAKLITIACEYTSSQLLLCAVFSLPRIGYLLNMQLSLLLYSHNLVYTDLAIIHH